MDDNKQQTLSQTQKPTMPQRPNEHSGLNIDEFVKITDPQTQKVILEKRG